MGSKYKRMLDLQITSICLSAATLLVTGYIAWQQWQIAKNKLRLDLFEKRFAAFEAALKLASSAVNKGDIPDEVRREFVTATRGVEFLFNRHLQAYCDKLAKEALDVRLGERRLETLPVGEQRTSVSQAWERRMQWFTEQMEEIPKRFGPFLKTRG
jgi:hypothetical protein